MITVVWTMIWRRWFGVCHKDVPKIGSKWARADIVASGNPFAHELIYPWIIRDVHGGFVLYSVFLTRPKDECRSCDIPTFLAIYKEVV